MSAAQADVAPQAQGDGEPPGRRCALREVLTGLGLVVALVVLLLVVDPSLRSAGELVFPVVYFSGATGLGRMVRSRERTTDAALRAAVEQTALREAAAVAAERASPARCTTSSRTA